MNTVAGDWKETAWNGIRLIAPSRWQPGTIGKQYLLLEEQSIPKMEIKWYRIQGPFSPETQIHHLGQRSKKGLKKGIAIQPLPSEWENALGNYQATGFSWVGETFSGRGVLLYCPECQLVTFFQFYLKGRQKHIPEAEKILSSFTDHSRDHQTFWRIFDIRAILPDSISLNHYRFEPGEYELSFRAKGQNIILRRWAPASVVLHGSHLDRWAKKIFPAPFGSFRLINSSEKDTEGAFTPASSPWIFWWNRITAQPSYMWYRIWQIAEKNCIFGVIYKGSVPFTLHVLNQISKEYIPV